MPYYVQANTSGRLHDGAEPSLSPLNRGFLYGDAVYEVWRSYHGTLFAFQEHWDRLLRSADALQLTVSLGSSDLIEEIRRTVAAYRAHTGSNGDVYVRLQFTRGEGEIGLDPALADGSTWVILVQALKSFVPGAGRRGLHLSVARQLFRNPPEALNPAWKTGNYLNNLLCLREARKRGADEVVILNRHGAVSEAAVCNVFFVRDGVLITPPLHAGILEGITRGLILGSVARRAGIEAREETLTPDDLAACSECFLSSSTRDVAPVEAIDGNLYVIGNDTVTTRIKEAFLDYAREYAGAHPELRL